MTRRKSYNADELARVASTLDDDMLAWLVETSGAQVYVDELTRRNAKWSASN